MDDQEPRRLRNAEWRAAHPVQSTLFWGSLWGVVLALLGFRTIGGLVLCVVAGNLLYAFIAWRTKTRDEQRR